MAGANGALTPVEAVELLRAKRPRFHAGGEDSFALQWDALAWLATIVRPGDTTLETGGGFSTVVFAAAGTRHTTISPDRVEHEAIQAWCAEHGITTDGVRFVAEPSHLALPAWDPEPLDVVLIDGAHGFPFPAVDWLYTSSHLRVGGVVAVDDAFIPAVSGLVRFLSASRDWEPLAPIGYRTAAYRKTGATLDYDWQPLGPDRLPRFGYLPPGARTVALARHLLIDRTRLGRRLVGALNARRGR